MRQWRWHHQCLQFLAIRKRKDFPGLASEMVYACTCTCTWLTRPSEIPLFYVELYIGLHTTVIFAKCLHSIIVKFSIWKSQDRTFQHSKTQKCEDILLDEEERGTHEALFNIRLFGRWGHYSDSLQCSFLLVGRHRQGQWRLGNNEEVRSEHTIEIAIFQRNCNISTGLSRRYTLSTANVMPTIR